MNPRLTAAERPAAIFHANDDADAAGVVGLPPITPSSIEAYVDATSGLRTIATGDGPRHQAATDQKARVEPTSIPAIMTDAFDDDTMVLPEMAADAPTPEQTAAEGVGVDLQEGEAEHDALVLDGVERAANASVSPTPNRSSDMDASDAPSPGVDEVGAPAVNADERAADGDGDPPQAPRLALEGPEEPAPDEGEALEADGDGQEEDVAGQDVEQEQVAVSEAAEGEVGGATEEADEDADGVEGEEEAEPRRVTAWSEGEGGVTPAEAANDGANMEPTALVAPDTEMEDVDPFAVAEGGEPPHDSLGPEVTGGIEPDAFEHPDLGEHAETTDAASTMENPHSLDADAPTADLLSEPQEKHPPNVHKRRGTRVLSPTSKPRSRRPTSADKITSVATAHYSTTFAAPPTAAAAVDLFPSEMPNNLILSEKPSVASPYVKPPMTRNTLMGKRMSVSLEATVLASATSATVAQAAAASAPSGTSGTFVGHSASDGVSADLASDIEEQRGGGGKGGKSLATFAFKYIRQMRAEKEQARLSMMRQEGAANADGPSVGARRASVALQGGMENSGVTMQSAPEPDPAPVVIAAPEPPPQLSVLARRDLPRRNHRLLPGAASGATGAGDESSSIPVLFLHHPSPTTESRFEAFIHNSPTRDRAPSRLQADAGYAYGSPAEDDDGWGLVRSLPTGSKVKGSSMIPVFMAPKRRVEIVDVSLAAGGDGNAEMEGLEEDADVDCVEVDAEGRRIGRRRHTAPAYKHFDGRKQTVMTKAGMRFEIKIGEHLDAPQVDELVGVLSTRANRLELQSGASRRAMPGPNLPSLESRPFTQHLKKHFQSTNPTSSEAPRRGPDDYFSQYSQPLPITRDSNPPQKLPTQRHLFLRELRSRREMMLQEAYLGQTGVNPRTFLRSMGPALERAVGALVGGKGAQNLAPTFSATVPSHEVYGELGQIHWRERIASRGRTAHHSSERHTTAGDYSIPTVAPTEVGEGPRATPAPTRVGDHEAAPLPEFVAPPQKVREKLQYALPVTRTRLRARLASDRSTSAQSRAFSVGATNRAHGRNLVSYERGSREKIRFYKPGWAVERSVKTEFAMEIYLMSEYARKAAGVIYLIHEIQEASNGKANDTVRGSDLLIDTALLGVMDKHTNKSMLQMIGELEAWQPTPLPFDVPRHAGGGYVLLRPRIMRNVDGIDVKMFEQALMARRAFEEERMGLSF
ncbi:hypothetical protein HK101_002131 [Irineochytrium annulatum]|nr:hypothetical protein HK101_002131 [Irineochytrium annulatum]